MISNRPSGRLVYSFCAPVNWSQGYWPLHIYHVLFYLFNHMNKKGGRLLEFTIEWSLFTFHCIK